MHLPFDASYPHVAQQLAGLARIKMPVLLDGVFPLLVPLPSWHNPSLAEIVAFDREVIARSGLKKFARPIAPVERRLMEAPATGAIIVIVTEDAPGHRRREARYLALLLTPRGRAAQRRKQRKKRRREGT